MVTIATKRSYLMEECSGKLGEGLKEILSSSVDWEKHLCSCTETVPFKRQHSRGMLSYGRVVPADLTLEYDVQITRGIVSLVNCQIYLMTGTIH
jgi:hypothetical protein